MTWSIALSLILYYEQNESTRLMVEGMGVITDELGRRQVPDYVLRLIAYKVKMEKEKGNL
ncbi:MAG: hypothetical protein K6G64_02905 [Eubacterium sp.]|nr:hypothetical protein [Eubacterium sp.]